MRSTGVTHIIPKGEFPTWLCDHSEFLRISQNIKSWVHKCKGHFNCEYIDELKELIKKNGKNNYKL